MAARLIVSYHGGEGLTARPARSSMHPRPAVLTFDRFPSEIDQLQVYQIDKECQTDVASPTE